MSLQAPVALWACIAAISSPPMNELFGLSRPAGLGAAVFLTAAALFAAVAFAVTGGSRLTLLDAGIAGWLHREATPPLTGAMMVATTLNSTYAIGLYATVIGLAQAWRLHWRRVTMLLVCVGGGLALNALVKLVFERARPLLEQPLLTLQTYSFPSGHVAGSTIFYGLFVAWVFGQTAQLAPRLAAIGLALAMVALTAFSRLYLGVHFLSDAIAGFAEGIAWLAFCLTALALLWPRRARTPPFANLAE